MNAPKLDPAEIARLLEPYAELSAGQLAKTRDYLELLLKWNARMNLTAVRDPEQIVTRHFGESFFAACRLLQPGWHGKVIDVGSGAGFPGIPIAMWCSEAEVTLIESNSRKAAFLNEVGRTLQMKNVRVVSQRAEVFEGRAELVTMRAVERFAATLPVALHLLASSGRIALMISSDQISNAHQAGNVIVWEEPILVPGGHSRVLLTGTKVEKVEQGQ